MRALSPRGSAGLQQSLHCVRWVLSFWALLAPGALLSAAPPAAWSSGGTLVAADGRPNDQFGLSVAISGQRIAVGSFQDDDLGFESGSVYLFERAGTAEWAQEVKILASDGAAVDHFGGAVALAGDRLVVGAVGVDGVGAATGAAYVLEADGEGSFSEVAKLHSSDPGHRDFFGTIVAVDGDLILVTAPNHGHLGANAGAAYVFAPGPLGGWVQTQELLAPDGAADDQLGLSAAMSETVIVLGAPLDDDQGSRSGAVWVFERDAEGLWTATAKLLPDDGAATDFFGNAVDVSGDTIVVGARGDDDLGDVAGSAYVFVRDAGGAWVQARKLLPADGMPGAEFGRSVAIDGGTIVVGAMRDDELAAGAGAAYVFERDPAGEWVESEKLFAATPGGEDLFGATLAFDGGSLVVGVPRSDLSGDDSGSAEVVTRFELSSSGACPGEVTLDVAEATPGGRVWLYWGRSAGSWTFDAGACRGTELGIDNAEALTILFADGVGAASLVLDMGSDNCDRLVQAVDVNTCETSRVVTVP